MKWMKRHTEPSATRTQMICGKLTQLALVWMLMMLLTGCQSTPWKLYRTINPYSKTQLPDPYGNTLRATGGAEFKIRKFYATKLLACLVLRVESKNSFAEVFINPHKARLVAGKVGIPAMVNTMAAREPMYRKMVQHYFKIKNPNDVPRWSRYYFPTGTIKGGKAAEGMLCFQLGEKLEDPQRLTLGKKCRMQLTGVMVAKGPASLDWIYFAPMTPIK